VPEAGEELEIEGLRVEVESVENDRVSSAIVTPPYLEDDRAQDSDSGDAEGDGQ
jgi:CBS domain containing-hemolysin-like protein